MNEKCKCFRINEKYEVNDDVCVQLHLASAFTLRFSIAASLHMMHMHVWIAGNPLYMISVQVALCKAVEPNVLGSYTSHPGIRPSLSGRVSQTSGAR